MLTSCTSICAALLEPHEIDAMVKELLSDVGQLSRVSFSPSIERSDVGSGRTQSEGSMLPNFRRTVISLGTDSQRDRNGTNVEALLS